MPVINVHSANVEDNASGPDTKSVIFRDDKGTPIFHIVGDGDDLRQFLFSLSEVIHRVGEGAVHVSDVCDNSIVTTTY